MNRACQRISRPKRWAKRPLNGCLHGSTFNGLKWLMDMNPYRVVPRTPMRPIAVGAQSNLSLHWFDNLKTEFMSKHPFVNANSQRKLRRRATPFCGTSAPHGLFFQVGPPSLLIRQLSTVVIHRSSHRPKIMEFQLVLKSTRTQNASQY